MTSIMQTVRGTPAKAEFTAEVNAEKEWVKLTITSDGNLKGLLIEDHTYDHNGKLSDLERHPYHFRKGLDVKKGDLVYVIAAKGQDLTKPYPGKPGNTVHYRYWGVRAHIWNDTGDTPSFFWTTPYAPTVTRA